VIGTKTYNMKVEKTIKIVTFTNSMFIFILRLRPIFFYYLLLEIMILSFISTVSTYAQSIDDITVLGTIRNIDNSVLSLKTIAIIESKSLKLIKQTISDNDGKFKFVIDRNLIGSGNFQIIVLTLNEKKNKYFKNFTILENTKHYDLGDFKVDNVPIELDEVKIIASSPLFDKRLDKLVVNVENSIFSGGNSIADILQKLPGVKADVNGEISVNGKEGVLITIDGKGQYVQKEQVQSIISSMRSESIRQIEIIANPSAKYDANQGSVINIVTKKNYAKSDIHANLGAPIYPVKGENGLKYSTFGIGSNLNYKFGKLSSNLSIDFSSSDSYTGDLQSNDFYNQLGVGKQIVSRIFNNMKSMTSRLGLSYDLIRRSSISLDLMLIKRPKYDINESNHIQFISQRSLLDSSILNQANNNAGRFSNFSLTAQYSLNLDTANKQHIDVFYDLTNFSSPSYNESGNIFNGGANQGNGNHLFTSTREYKININSFKVDYRNILSQQWIIYSGLKYSRIVTSDTLNSFQQNQLSFRQFANGRFVYNESIFGGYFMVSGKFKRLEAQVGLRGEYTLTEGRTATVNNIAENKYFNLFPSASFLFTANNDNKIGISFNRRIVRLGFGDLNPISRYVSPFLISQGNPNLRPQFVNYIELTYQFKKLYMSLSHSIRSNSRIDIPLATNSAILQTNQFTNIRTVRIYELNLSHPIPYAKWWSSFNNINISNNTSILPDKRLSYTGYSLYSSQNFKIATLSTLELSAVYNSKSQSYYTLSKSTFSLNFGFKQALFSKRFDLTVSANDLLGTNKYRAIINYPTQLSTIDSFKNNRSASISLRYNFNSGNAFGRSNSSSKGDFGEKRF
jgi:hypothetical protein